MVEEEKFNYLLTKLLGKPKMKEGKRIGKEL